MTEKKMSQILEQTESNFQILGALQEDIVKWGGPDGRDLPLPLVKELRKWEDDVDEMPEGWIEAVLTQYLLGRMFGREQLVKQFLKSPYAARYETEYLDWCRFFNDNSWFYMVYIVEKQEAGDLFRVRDIGSGERRLLRSTSTLSLYREGFRIFMSLVFKKGDAYQCYSIIHPWMGLQPFDFHTFARMTDSDWYTQHGLSWVIEKHFHLFAMLGMFANAPGFRFKGLTLDYYIGSYRVAGFDPSDYRGGGWIQKEKNGVIEIRFQPDSMVRKSGLYYEKSRKTLHILARSEAEYSLLVELSGYELEPEPQMICSLLMQTIMEKLTGQLPPVIDFLKYFENINSGERLETPAPDNRRLDPAELDTINALMQRMTECEIKGIPFELDQLAEEYGVEPEDARNMYEVLHEHDDTFTLGMGNSLKGFTPPPLANRARLQSVFTHCSLFSFTENPAVMGCFRPILEKSQIKYNSAVKAIKPSLLSPEHLPRLMEELFHHHFKKFGEPVFLNYTVYMLSRVGKRKQRLWDYTREMLETFWQLFFEEKTAVDFEATLAAHGRLFEAVLVPLGLAVMELDLNMGSPYLDCRVQASDLFFKWLTLED